MWFERLTGFAEESPKQVRSIIIIEGEQMTSLVNGVTFRYGKLEIPSLAELRDRVHSTDYVRGEISVREVVANVQQLHTDTSNADALFQVASQFNLLEMVSPNATPEEGIGIYEYDRTQGPACAIAAGAGTIYRNYFADVNGQIGQSVDNQIDCLADLGTALGNADGRLWTMQNGYALPSESGLSTISERLQSATEDELDELRQLLRIGVQWHTQVTLDNCQHTVSQAYGSALPVAYSRLPAHLWAEFAQLVLDASYEATVCTAIHNAAQTGNRTLFLTLLGGGAFGNETQWILAAIQRALTLYRDANLDVAIVSYGASNPALRQLITNS